MALGSGRFSSPSLGVLVTANIQHFQHAIGQLPSITKSAFDQAAQHIRAFNSHVVSSFTQVGTGLQGAFASVAKMMERLNSSVRGYFRRTPGDDLGIPELAGIMNPSRFDQQVSAFQSRLRAAGQNIRSTLQSAFGSVRNYFKRNPMDDLGIPEFAGRLDPSKFMQHMAPFIKVWDAVSSAAHVAAGKATSVWNKVWGSISTVGQAAIGKVGTAWTNTFSNLNLTGRLTSVFNTLGTLGTNVASRIGTAWSNMVAGIQRRLGAGGTGQPPPGQPPGQPPGGRMPAFSWPTLPSIPAAFHNINKFFNDLLGKIFSLRTAMAALGSFFVVRFAKDVVSSFIEAGAELQNFKLQLEAVFRGSLPMVDDVMDRLIKFARETPFSTQETVRAFNIMSSAGFDASEATMQALGKLAFSFHRSMEDVARDFVSQRTQSLHTFGIHIQYLNNRTAVMMGDTMRIVSRSRDEVVKALAEVVNETLPGLTEKALNTWKGVVEFFGSIWWEIRSKIGTSILTDLQPKILAFGHAISKMNLQGKFDGMADAIGRAVGRIGGALADQGMKLVNWLAGLNADEVEDLFDKIISYGENVFTKTKEFLSPILNFVLDMVRTFDGLPASVKEVGIIAAFLFGPGSAVALLAGLTLLNRIGDTKFFAGGGIWDMLTKGKMPTLAPLPAGAETPKTPRPEKPYDYMEGTKTYQYNEFGKRVEVKPEKPAEMAEGITTSGEVLSKALSSTAESTKKAAVEIEREQGAFTQGLRALTTIMGTIVGFKIGGIPGAAFGGYLGNKAPEMTLPGPSTNKPKGIMAEGLDFLRQRWNSFFQTNEQDMLNTQLERINMTIATMKAKSSLQMRTGFGLVEDVEARMLLEKLEFDREIIQKNLDALVKKPIAAAVATAGKISDSVSAMIDRFSVQYNVDPALIAAIFKTESSMNLNAPRGDAGAKYGLAGGRPGEIGGLQVLPNTARELGFDPEAMLKDPLLAFEAGVAYISKLLEKFGGSVQSTDQLMRTVISAYNVGPNNKTLLAGAVPNGPYTDKTYAAYQELSRGGIPTGPAVNPIAPQTAFEKQRQQDLRDRKKDEDLELGRIAESERKEQTRRNQLQLFLNTELNREVIQVQKLILTQQQAIGTIGMHGEALEMEKSRLEGVASIEEVMIKTGVRRNEVMIQNVDELSEVSRQLLRETGILDENNKSLTTQQYVTASLSSLYAKLGESRAKAFALQTEFKVVETLKNQLEDLRLVLNFETAITSQNRAQAEVDRIITNMTRDGYSFLKDEASVRKQLVELGKDQEQVDQAILNLKERATEEMRARLLVYQAELERIREIQKRHQELSQSIQSSLTGIEDTMANAFGKLTTLFTTKGKQDWKGFFTGLLTDIKSSVDQAIAAMAKATFSNFLKDFTGFSTDEWKKKIGDQTATNVVGKATVDPNIQQQAALHMAEIQQLSKAALADMGDAVRQLYDATKMFTVEFGNNKANVEALAKAIMEDRAATADFRDAISMMKGVLGGYNPTMQGIGTTTLPQESELPSVSEAIRLGRIVSPETTVAYNTNMVGAAGKYRSWTDEIEIGPGEGPNTLAHEWTHALQMKTGIGARAVDKSKGPYAEYGTVPDIIHEGAADIIAGTSGYLPKMNVDQISQASSIAEMLMAASREQAGINLALESYGSTVSEGKMTLEDFDNSLSDFLVDLNETPIKGIPQGYAPQGPTSGIGMGDFGPVLLGAAMGGMAGGMKGALAGGLMGLAPLLTKAISNGIKNGASQGAEAAAVPLSALADDTESMFGSAISSIGGWFTGVLGSIGSGLMGILGSFSSGISSLLGSIGGGGGGGSSGGGGINWMSVLGAGLGSMFSSLGGMAGGMFSSAGAVGTAATPVGGNFAGGPSAFPGALGPMPNFGAAQGGYMTGFSDMAGIVTRPQSRILALAEGGITPSLGMSGIATNPTLVSIGENAPSQFEAVVPLPDNKSIPVMFKGGVGDSGSGRQHMINLNIDLNTTVLDPASLRTSSEEIIGTVKANYDGDGVLRTSIREDIGRG
jgi:hypothetical protein